MSLEDNLTSVVEPVVRAGYNIKDSVSNIGAETDADRIERESFVGRGGGISYEQFLQTQVPINRYIPGEEPKGDNNLEVGKWEAFASRVSRNANADMTGFAHFIYKNFIGHEDGYNPYDDPSLKNESPEFQIKYARDFSDSPNSRYTAGLVKQIKQTEDMIKRTAHQEGAAFAGELVGGAANVSNFVGLRAAMLGESVLSKAVTTGLSGAMSMGIQGAGQRQFDPTLTQEEVAYNMAGGFLLGSALGAIGGTFTREGTEELRKVIAPDLNKLPNKSLTQILEEGSSAGAMSRLEDGGHGLAETNSFFNGVAKTLNIGAEQDGLRSLSKNTRYYTNLFTSHNFRTEGSLKGKAVPVSLNNIADAEMNLGLQPLVNDLDTAYAAFKREGGKLDQEAFLNEAFEVHAGIHGTSSRATSQAASGFTKFFKHFADRHMSVDPNFKPRQDYIPGIPDRKSVIKNQATLYEDIRNELLNVARREDIEFRTKTAGKELAPEKLAELEAKKLPVDIEDPKFQEAVEAIYERMALDSAGNFRTKGVKAWDNMNLKPRTLNFSNEFYNKYRPTDVMQLATVYARKSARSLASKKYIGSSDPYVVLDGIKEDYRNLIANVSKEKTGNSDKLIKDLHKALESDLERTTNLIEIFTGQALQKYSGVTRDTTAVLKAANYLTTMGMAAVNMITDLVRSTSSHLSQVGFADDILKQSRQVADIFKALPDDKAGRLYGAVADPITGVSRSTLFADVVDVPVMTTVERGTQLASRIYSKLNLMEPINNVTRKAVAEDVSRKILKLGRDLVDGKITEGSYDSLELAKIGIDKDLARKVIQEFDKHQEVVMFGNKKVLTTGIDSWNPDVAAYYIGAVQKAVNNTIIIPTAGAKPFWTNTPWGSVIAALKSFTLVSLNKYLLPALQDIKGVHPRAATKALSIMIGDLALSSQVQLLRDASSGKEVDYTPGYVITSALTKNATFAILGLADGVAGLGGVSAAQVFGGKPSYYYNEADYIKGAVSQVFGPVAAYPINAFDVAWDASHGGYSDAEYRRSLQLIPGNNLIYWNWAVQQIGKRPQQINTGNNK